MKFADPLFLLLLLLAPLLAIRYRRRPPAAIPFSDTSLLTGVDAYRPVRIAPHLPFILRMAAAVLIVVALARPQTGHQEREVTSRGIDIMLTLDLSSSMTATDFEPTRLAAAKEVIRRFIEGRTSDRIGLVVFASRGYTRCPLTLDYRVLIDFLMKSDVGLVDDGTAIGLALATAVNRLRDSDAKSRIVVLLTDGLNNRGAIDPVTAARAAQALGIRVYTVGVGREGIFTMTVDDPRFGKRQVRTRTEIDEELLDKIARITGGRFYRAQDEAALARIYGEIDSLEKTDLTVKVHERYTDWFGYLLLPALLLLAAGLVLPLTPWRSLP